MILFAENIVGLVNLLRILLEPQQQKEQEQQRQQLIAQDVQPRDLHPLPKSFQPLLNPPMALIATTVRNEGTLDFFQKTAAEHGLHMSDVSDNHEGRSLVRFIHRQPDEASNILLSQITLLERR